ncbi:glycosyltransferase family 2 protein [Faecalibacter rhinopitheci]|uniref:Glycosyltransferase family 2 protein n=1 Tax=Faecalibacter rhinopitheci TaxID=2779678 RepID=A0A8J7FQ41_9FLAO|nr:glycosyltransferase family 2 protein [Faecalibacter rhinopitheci]MBF0597494.1 glycosyltransferase family 2 protein [Faecalibacter rhinopitheci]
MEDQPNDIMVSICCTAYNHEKFIEQTLEGFIMQQCNFKFEILISDDASPDNTASIIKKYEDKYPDLFRVFYLKENQYSKGIKPLFNILFPAAKGKYIAICEGDDYWTDPLKLQRQVDFLEENLQYSCCFHRYLTLEENGIFKDELLPHISVDTIINTSIFFRDWYTKTLTSLIRKSDLDKSKYYKYIDARDTVLFYELLNVKQGICLNFKGGVYRKHLGGIWSLKSALGQKKISTIVLEEIYSFNKKNLTLVNYIKKNIVFLITNQSFKSNLDLYNKLNTIYFKNFLIKQQILKYKNSFLNMFNNKV